MFSVHIEYTFNEKVLRSSKRSISNSKISFKSNQSIIRDYKERKIGNKISDYINNVLIKTIVYTVIGTAFLLVNAIFITSFCGIYPNSVISLFVNTLMSILFSCILIVIFRSIGVSLRYFGLKQKNELMYNISRFFNILNLTWNDFIVIISKIKEKRKEKEKSIDKNLKDCPDDEKV
jgi:uncharacterized protein YacL